jgi:hypothetical protein
MSGPVDHPLAAADSRSTLCSFHIVVLQSSRTVCRAGRRLQGRRPARRRGDTTREVKVLHMADRGIGTLPLWFVLFT